MENSWKNDRNMKEHVHKYAGLNGEIFKWRFIAEKIIYGVYMVFLMDFPARHA